MLSRLFVPQTLDFAELALEREAITQRLLFLPGPLAELCRFNGLDPAHTLADEDLSCWLITEWYCTHREVGGDLDPVAEQLLAEVADDEASGIAIVKHGDRPH